MARIWTTICVSFFLFKASNADRDIGFFWHVTDFHFDHTYGGQGLSCNADVSMDEKYGDYWCDSPWLLVQDSINNMAVIEPNVDFILWTGDNVAHIKDEDLSLEKNLETLSNITTALKNAFRYTPVHASLGNHDFWPSDQAVPGEDDFYHRVSDMWKTWLMENNINSFQKGGYYKVDLSRSVLLLVLNTNLYYNYNKKTASGRPGNMDDPAGQFAFMIQHLNFARNEGIKVMVTAHVPPGLKTPGLGDSFHPHYRKRFMDIITSYSDVIVAGHFGHDHLDNFKVLQNEDGTRAVPQFSAPSVTPWRWKGSTETAPAHNPAIRLVKYDRNSGANLDYDQYYMNLTDSNKNGRTEWKILYTFTKAYNVRDMSAASLKKIFENMKTKGNNLGQQYCDFSLVSTFKQECTDEMQAQIYCGGLYDKIDKARECVQKEMGNSGPTLGSHVLVILLCVFVSCTYRSK